MVKCFLLFFVSFQWHQVQLKHKLHAVQDAILWKHVNNNSWIKMIGKKEMKSSHDALMDGQSYSYIVEFTELCRDEGKMKMLNCNVCTLKFKIVMVHYCFLRNGKWKKHRKRKLLEKEELKLT